MKANFQALPSKYSTTSQDELDSIATRLGMTEWISVGKVSTHHPPEGFEGFYSADVLGEEFVWMNETFPKDKFTWYFWFESVFIVPPEMASFLIVKWS